MGKVKSDENNAVKIIKDSVKIMPVIGTIYSWVDIIVDSISLLINEPISKNRLESMNKIIKYKFIDESAISQVISLTSIGII